MFNNLRTFIIVLIVCLFSCAAVWAAKQPEPAKGWQALREMRYADALKSADSVLHINPDDKDAHWLAAEVYLALKDTTKSLNHWFTVVDNEPANRRAVVVLVELLLAQNDTTDAEAVIDAAVRKKPNYAEFDYCKGLLCIAKGQEEEAMVEFTRAIDKNDAKPSYFSALARVYRDKNILTLAEQNYLAALEIDSTNANLHFELAQVMMDLKEYNDALAHFKSARDLNPNIPDVNYQIGKLYFYAEKYEQAVSELKTALENGKEDNFYINSFLGQSLRALKQLDEAQGYLEKAYKLKPTEVSTFKALANNSYELKKYDRAIELLKAYIAVYPPEASDYSKIGEAYYNISSKDSASIAFYDSAALYLKKSLELNPANSRLAYMIGMAYFTTDQYDSALVYFNKKVQADSSSFPSYFYLGYCYLKKEMYPECIYNLRKANQLDSSKVAVHMMLGQTLTFMDSSKAAKLEYQYALQLDSTLADAYGGLGFILLNEEEWSRAAANLKKAVDLRPQNPSFWLAYGQASYYLQDYDTAEKAFRKTLQIDPKNKDARNGLDTIETVKFRKKL